ncbi:MAG TPA: ABC transporter permease [Gemmatimonadales bacterium]|nr:ABC transporter permease [Gemmatimonadales bacterium]
MRTVFFLVRKEFLQIFRDRTTVFQIFMIPVVQLLVLANAATFDVKRVKTLVVDEDRTTVSAGLVQRLRAGRQFEVVRYEGTDAGVDHALLDREVTAVLHIPRRFEEDLVRRGRAPVQLVLNAEEGATAGIVQSYATEILASYAAELDRTLPAATATGRTPRVAPLDLRTQRWYNPTRNYKYWMVPALMVSLTTIIALLLTAQNITRENELGTLEQLNVTPMTKIQFIAAKLIPFWLLSMLIFSIGLAIGWLVFDIPMRGNLALVYLAAAVYLIVVLGTGLGISTITRTQQQSMFVAFFLILIFLLMSGLFTPVDSMPDWAQRVAEANPVKHFVSIMRAVLMRGAGLETVGRPIVGLGIAGVAVLALAVMRYRKSVA